MKIIGIIPARYASTRFPGKPLADIHGKPMIKWVYDQAVRVNEFSSVYIATDDQRISDVCEWYNIPYLMTGNDTPNHIVRIWEVSKKIDADFYVSINGDEPMIDPDNIKVVLNGISEIDGPYFCSAYRNLTDPTEVMDISNVKIVLNKEGICLYQSRNPIPSTKATLDFQYKKAIGIECFNKAALDFFASAEMGVLEKIEDIDHLRFLEHGIPIYYKEIKSESISVDTPKDLDRVRKLLKIADKNGL